MLAPSVRCGGRLDPSDRCSARRSASRDDRWTASCARAIRSLAPHSLRCECGASAISEPSPKERSDRGRCLCVLTTRRAGRAGHLSPLRFPRAVMRPPPSHSCHIRYTLCIFGLRILGSHSVLWALRILGCILYSVLCITYSTHHFGSRSVFRIMYLLHP